MNWKMIWNNCLAAWKELSASGKGKIQNLQKLNAYQERIANTAEYFTWNVHPQRLQREHMSIKQERKGVLRCRFHIPTAAFEAASVLKYLYCLQKKGRPSCYGLISKRMMAQFIQFEYLHPLLR